MKDVIKKKKQLVDKNVFLVETTTVFLLKKLTVQSFDNLCLKVEEVIHNM